MSVFLRELRMTKKNDFNWGTFLAGAGAYKAASADGRLKKLQADESERQRKLAYQEKQHRNIYRLHQGLEKIREMPSPEDRIECLEYMLNTAVKQINISAVNDIGYKDRYYETERRFQEELKKAQDELTQQQIEKLEQEINDKSIIADPVVRYQNLKIIGEGFSKINLLFLYGDKYKKRYQKAQNNLISEYKKIEKELGKERWNSIIELENSLPKLSNLLWQLDYKDGKMQYTKSISTLTPLCAVIRKAHEIVPEYPATELDKQLLTADKFIQAYQDAIAMLKCMISLAKIHGGITKKQTKLILKFCRKIFLNKEDFNAMLPVADDFSFSENLSKRERIVFLLNLKKIMQSEPATSSSWEESFYNTCKSLGIDEKELPSGISAIWFKLKLFFGAEPRLKTCVPIEAGAPKKRLTYILLGILLGFFWVHNFYAGYTFKGLAQLLISTIIPPIALMVFIWVGFELFTVKKDAKGVRFS